MSFYRLSYSIREVGSVSALSAKRRLDWIDIAKGIAILLVIVGHTVSIESHFRQYIFSFHIPLFFILAGYTFRIKDWRELVPASAARLLLPAYLIELAWHVPQFFMLNESFSTDMVWRFLGMMFYASGTGIEVYDFEAFGMAWFLVALFASRLLMNGFMKLFERWHVAVPVQGLVLVALAVLGLSMPLVYKTVLPFSLDISFYAVFLMWVGHMAARVKLAPERVRWYVALVVAVVWFTCMSMSSFELSARHLTNPIAATIAAVAGTFVVCWLSYQLERVKSVPVVSLVEKFLVFCGKYSMAIFCVHAIDWMIPWTSLSLLEGAPLPKLLASCVRIFADVSVAAALKKS